MKDLKNTRVRLTQLKQKGFKVIYNKSKSYTGFTIGSGFQEQIRNKVLMLYDDYTLQTINRMIDQIEAQNDMDVIGKLTDLIDETI